MRDITMTQSIGYDEIPLDKNGKLIMKLFDERLIGASFVQFKNGLILAKVDDHAFLEQPLIKEIYTKTGLIIQAVEDRESKELKIWFGTKKFVENLDYVKPDLHSNRNVSQVTGN